MYCIKCCKEINEGALYCRYCGAPQEMKKADDDNAIQSSTKATADGEGTESGQTEKRHQEKETESIIKKKSFLPWLIGGAAVVSILVIVIAAITTVAIYNTPMNRYNRQLSLGNRYVDELDYERAIAAYRAAIEIDPNNPEAYKALADLYIAIDDNESALEVALSGVDATGDSGLKTLASDIGTEMNAPMAAEPSDEGNDAGNDESGTAGGDTEYSSEADDPEPVDDSWKLAMRDAVEAYMLDNWEYVSECFPEENLSRQEYYDGSQFHIIYINEDDIPEIAVDPYAYGALGMGHLILYMEDGALESQGINWCDTVSYIPYSNMVCFFHGMHIPYLEYVTHFTGTDYYDCPEEDILWKGSFCSPCGHDGTDHSFNGAYMEYSSNGSWVTEEEYNSEKAAVYSGDVREIYEEKAYTYDEIMEYLATPADQ